MAQRPRAYIYTVTTLSELIDKWEALTDLEFCPRYSSAAECALPLNGKDFKPNPWLLNALLKAFKIPVAASLESIDVKPNVLHTRLTRWRRERDRINTENRFINTLPEHEQIAERSDKAYVKTVAQLHAHYDLVPWAGWLRILAKLGILEPALIAGLPSRQRKWAKRLDQMAKEWVKVSRDIALNEGEEDAVQMPERMSNYGKVYVAPESFNIVLDTPEISGAKLGEKYVNGVAVFVGLKVVGDVLEAMPDAIFINCLFSDLFFQSEMTAARFLGCEFAGVCGFTNKVSQHEIEFRSCVTGEYSAPLSLQYCKMAGVRFIDCGGLCVDVTYTSLRDGKFINGWVNTPERTTDGQRLGPKSVFKTEWINGGLCFDLRGYAAHCYPERLIDQLVKILVPADIVDCEAIDEKDGEPLGVTVGELAAQAFEEGQHTRSVAENAWQYLAP